MIAPGHSRQSAVNAPASPNPSQRFVKKLRRTSAGALCPRYCEIMIPATAPMAAMTTA